MKFNKRLMAAVLLVVMMLSMMPVQAAELQATYQKASYYSIATTNYSRMLMFKNGVVIAANEQQKFGLIDATGAVVVPLQYGKMEFLGNDLYAVSTTAEGWTTWDPDAQEGIINSRGKIVLPMGAASIQKYGDVIVVQTEDGSQNFDMNMKPVVESTPSNENINTTDMGVKMGKYTYVQKWDPAQCSLLDSSGKAVIPAGKYSSIEMIQTANGEMFYVRSTSDQNVQCALLGANFKEVIPMGTYDQMDFPYSEATSYLKVSKRVGTAEQKGLIDTTGKIIVPLGNYREVDNPSIKGFVAVRSYDGETYDNTCTNLVSSIFNLSGKEVKKFPGKEIGTAAYFRDLTFKAGEKWGIMDEKETVVVPAQFDVIDKGYGGTMLTQLKKADSWEYLCGMYTAEGKMLFDTKYSTMNHVGEGNYLLGDDVNYGLVTYQGKYRLPMKYKDLRVHTLNFIEAYDGTDYCVLTADGKEVLPKSKELIALYDASGHGMGYDLQRVEDNKVEYDNYSKNVQPFGVKTAKGYVTMYADYVTGDPGDSVPYKASNINSEGLFAYQAENGLFGIGKKTGVATTIPAAPEYHYDTADVGESVVLPTDKLNAITSSETATAAVTAAVAGMTAEQKNSATGIDRATLFAEEATGRAASKKVTGPVLINAATVADLEKVAETTSAAVQTALLAGKVTTARLLSNTVRLITDETGEVTINIDPDIVKTKVDKVRVETPSYAITLKISDIAADLAAGKPVTITAQDVGTGFAPDSKSKVTTVKLNLPNGKTTNPVTVSMPKADGDANYQAVTSTEGKATPSKRNPATGKMDAKIAQSGTYTVKTNQKDFGDIAQKSAEMQKAIRYLSAKGIIGGTGDKIFSPDGSISRAEIAALLMRALGKLDSKAVANFPDVKSSDWFYTAAGSSVKHGIMNGMGDGTFSGTKVIAKDQIVSVAARVLKTEMNYKVPADAKTYLDKYGDQVANWAKDDVSLATRENMVLQRIDGNFKGDGSMTRGDAAIIIYRLFNKIW